MQNDNTKFVRMALNLHLIDIGQFNDVMAELEKDPTVDSAIINILRRAE